MQGNNNYDTYTGGVSLEAWPRWKTSNVESKWSQHSRSWGRPSLCCSGGAEDGLDDDGDDDDDDDDEQ